MPIPKPDVIVLSDLHLGAGPLDDFDEVIEGHFCELLHNFASSIRPVELVINGDFIDFVQAPPSEGDDLEAETPQGTPLCFTEAQSNEKLSAVLGAHRNVFRALGDLVEACPQNLLTILPGNHDSDLFWPTIRKRLRDACTHSGSSSERVRFCLAQVYRPSSAPHAWIEHGHQHDELNRFYVRAKPHWSAERPPILRDRSGTARLLECTGTRFLIRYLNGLDGRYHFVDNVKPFSRFIRALAASRDHWYDGPIRLIAEIWKFRRYVQETAFDHPSDLLSASVSSDSIDQEAIVALRKRIAATPPSGKDAFGAALGQAGVTLRSSVSVFLDSEENALTALHAIADQPSEFDQDFGLERGNPNLPRVVSSREVRAADKSGTLALGKGFTFSETDLLADAARKALSMPSVGCVLMGHTHVWVDPSVNFPYANTGCWIRYLNLDHSTSFTWRDLQMPYARYPFQLRFATLERKHPGVHITIHAYQGDER